MTKPLFLVYLTTLSNFNIIPRQIREVTNELEKDVVGGRRGAI